MLTLKWIFRLFQDVALSGYVNRSWLLSAAVMSLIVLGLVFAAAQISAPFIYALF